MLSTKGGMMVVDMFVILKTSIFFLVCMFSVAINNDFVTLTFARESGFDLHQQLAQVDEMFRSVLATSAANQLIDK